MLSVGRKGSGGGEPFRYVEGNAALQQCQHPSYCIASLQVVGAPSTLSETENDRSQNRPSRQASPERKLGL